MLNTNLDLATFTAQIVKVKICSAGGLSHQSACHSYHLKAITRSSQKKVIVKDTCSSSKKYLTLELLVRLQLGSVGGHKLRDADAHMELVRIREE